MVKFHLRRSSSLRDQPPFAVSRTAYIHSYSYRHSPTVLRKKIVGLLDDNFNLQRNSTTTKMRSTACRARHDEQHKFKQETSTANSKGQGRPAFFNTEPHSTHLELSYGQLIRLPKLERKAIIPFSSEEWSIHLKPPPT